MGWKSFIGCGQANNDTVAIGTGQNNNGVPITVFAPIGGPIVTSSWVTSGGTTPLTLANGQLNNYAAHTASLMTFWMTSNSSTVNIYNRLSIGQTGANPTPNGNQIAQCTPSDTGTKAIQDISNTDAVPGSGTTVALGQGFASAGSGQVVYTGVFWVADCPGGACVPLSAAGTNNSTVNYRSNGNSTTNYGGLNGNAQITSPIGSVQVCMPTAGISSKIQINIVPNAYSGGGSSSCALYTSTTFNSTAIGNQNIALVASSIAGGGITLESTSHTDAILGGSAQFMAIGTCQGTINNSLRWSAFGTTWTSAQPNVTPLTTVSVAQSGGLGSFGRCELGYTVFRPSSPSQGPGNEPPEGPANIPIAGVFSGLNVVTSTAGTQGTVQSMIANVVGNQAATISPGGAGGTGVQSDISHTDAMAMGANTQFSGYYGSSFVSGTSIASHAVNFRTPDGTGAFSFGLG